MPSCVEVALLRLKKPSSTAELEKNEVHRTALDIVTSQPRNLGCTWAVLSEDPTLLVWLVDWEEMEDHTKGFMHAPIYQHFNDLFTTLLEDKPIVYMTHFTFPESPSRLASARHPTLQVLQTCLAPDTDAEAALAAFKPVEEVWKAQDRKYVLAQALDEGMQDRTLCVVAWKDIVEHKTAKQDPDYLNKFVPCKKHWKDIQLFGHITPSHAPPQPAKQ